METTWALLVSAVMHAALSGSTLLGDLQVELLEDERAQVVRMDSGDTCILPRGALPRGAREGDVLREGRVDLARTRAMAQRVQDLQRRATRSPASLEEGEGPGPR